MFYSAVYAVWTISGEFFQAWSGNFQFWRHIWIFIVFFSQDHDITVNFTSKIIPFSTLPFMPFQTPKNGYHILWCSKRPEPSCQTTRHSAAARPILIHNVSVRQTKPFQSLSKKKSFLRFFYQNSIIHIIVLNFRHQNSLEWSLLFKVRFSDLSYFFVRLLVDLL